MPIVDRLRERFGIRRICVVADRGMISAETIAALEERKLEYILGARERTDKLVREVVLADDAPFVPLALEKRVKTTEYAAKAVEIGKLRYIVCVNHGQAAKDAADRAAILESLVRQLKRGDKALVGNTGYRRYLKTTGQDRFAVDHDKVEADTKFDGIFVLRTNTALDPVQAMLRYKQLWTVEQVFRTTKDILGTRPIARTFAPVTLPERSAPCLTIGLDADINESIQRRRHQVAGYVGIGSFRGALASDLIITAGLQGFYALEALRTCLAGRSVLPVA